MSKWFGKIGFGETQKITSGYWSEVIVEKEFYGDVYSASRSYQTSGSHINDDINMAVKVSVLSNHYLNENLDNIKYVEYMGTKWRVTSMTAEYPRVTLSLGGVYNVQRDDGPD